MSGPQPGHVRTSLILPEAGLTWPLCRVPERFVGYVQLLHQTYPVNPFPQWLSPFAGLV
jgi:hypothetical protein